MPESPELRLDPAREEQELRAYLGHRFELDSLWRSEEQIEQEFLACGDEDAFYRTSPAYLYNLTAFAMSGTKLPYLRELTRHLRTGARVLDYGCGIGSDGLLLLEAGYRVEFADFDNPSTEYLRWRLRHRGLHAAVHDLDGQVPGGFDAAYAFDVIEHVRNPFELLAELERRARIVEVNLLEPLAGDSALHRELPVGTLLAHVATRRMRHHRLLYGRSHLVLYESEIAPAAARARNRARLAAGRLARRIPAIGQPIRRPAGSLVRRLVRRR